MNAISFKKWVSTILLLAITISLCGCSTNRTAASQDEHLTTTTAFIVLNGANVPALNSSAIASFVDTPQDGDRSILIVPDGNPSITTFSFDSTAKNVTYATAESKKWYKEICTSIIDARPDDADTDLLSAILLAANELKASDTQARHLMLLCNGLNTAPMLNFAETPFWSDATSIDEIISQLLKLNYLSADLLEDVDVTWAYLTSTSGLQKSLSPSMESRLLSFWQAYFDACGAKSVGVMHMTDTERSMITLQELLRSTSVTVDQYKEAIYFCVATDTSQVDESKKESYCDACVTALIHLMKYTAPSTDDPKAFCLDLIQLQLTLHLTLCPLLLTVVGFFSDCSCTNCDGSSTASQSPQCLLGPDAKHILSAACYDKISRL